MKTLKFILIPAMLVSFCLTAFANVAKVEPVTTVKLTGNSQFSNLPKNSTLVGLGVKNLTSNTWSVTFNKTEGTGFYLSYGDMPDPICDLKVEYNSSNDSVKLIVVPNSTYQPYKCEVVQSGTGENYTPTIKAYCPAGNVCPVPSV